MTSPNRRTLYALAGVPALAIPAIAIGAVAPPDADAELVALAAEVDRLCALNDDIRAERIEPFEGIFQGLMDEALASQWSDPTNFLERWDKAWEYSRESGREAGVDKVVEVEGQADRVWKRMTAIPAATQSGRAAKVRALLTHVCPSEWRGPKSDLDWDLEQARALLGEFAGMTEEELAAI